MLKLNFYFDFIVKTVISRRILYSNKDVIILLQSKNNDFLTGFYSLQSLSNVFKIIRVNTAASGQELGQTSILFYNDNNNNPSQNISEFYKRSLTIPLVDEVWGN